MTTGTNNSETLYGSPGADWIRAYDGNDTVHGGYGNDVINGGRGNDTLYGEAGDDTFEVGGSGSDMGLTPAGGVQNGWDHFHGGDGYDTIAILPTSGFTWTAIQIASMTGIEAITNNSGGPGYVFFSGAIDFSGVVSITGIDQIAGSSGNDQFTGGIVGETVYGLAGNDTLVGNGGNDTLNGGDGNDVLMGGTGDDVLAGGAGTDWFWFEAGHGVDIVADFLDGTDKIVVGQSVQTVNVTDYQGQALLHLNDTLVLLANVAPTAVDASDFLWA